MRFKGRVFRKGLFWLTVAGELREEAGGWVGVFWTYSGFWSGPGDRLELLLEDGRRARFEILGGRLTPAGDAEVRFALTEPLA